MKKIIDIQDQNHKRKKLLSLSVADSVEAAVRSMKEPNAEKIHTVSSIHY